MINNKYNNLSTQVKIDAQKHIKELKKHNLNIEIELLKNSIIINIINFKEIIPSNFSSCFSFEEIIKKDEGLSSFKSLDKIFTFFKKVDRDKFKIEEKDNFFILKFFYEDKLEDIEIEFIIKEKEFNSNGENKILKNSINEMSQK